MGPYPVHHAMNRSWARIVVMAGMVYLFAGAAHAQDLGRLDEATFEFAGSWERFQSESTLGQDLAVDSSGIPLNDEGRMRALSYNESQLSMVERQCAGWPDHYLLGGGPFGLRIWSELDPVKGNVISYTIGAWEDRPALTIWMDGRPHPSKYAEHTRAGFTTGVWERGALVTTTTHMNAGVLRRSGAVMSDEATLTLRFYRHGDVLTILGILEDPIYLAEPWTVSSSYRASATTVAPLGPPCITTFEASVGDTVPHYLPEKNPFIDEVTQKYGVPRDAVVGRPETLYPEYRKTMSSQTPAR